jgi:hypothetical protein
MAERFIRRGLPESNATMLAYGYQTIAAGYADRTTDAVRTLTGKSPMNFQMFAKANADVWRRVR